MEGVKDFRVPLRVRTEKGMGNSKIADFMIEKRGSSSMLLGKSVHNQRIERWWRDVLMVFLAIITDCFISWRRRKF